MGSSSQIIRETTVKLTEEQFQALAHMLSAACVPDQYPNLRLAIDQSRKVLVEDSASESDLLSDENINRALIGIRPDNHPEAHRILTYLKQSKK